MYKYVDIEKYPSPENESMLNCDTDIIEVSEKVDAGNFSLFMDETGLIHECSRNRDLTTDKDDKTFIKHRIEMRKLLKDKLHPDYIYYMEIMQRHTINYGEKVSPVIGYDIRVKEGAFGKTPMFLQPEQREKEFDRIGIPNVHVLFRGTVKEFKEKNINDFLKDSAYYDGQKEGVVIKNYGRCNTWGRQMFGKIVNIRFKETNHAKFGTLIKKDTSDTQKIFDTTVTDARIEKAFNKLVNEGGQELGMKLMQFLPMDVVADVFKEESRTILKAKVFYPDSFKDMVAKQCVKFLNGKMMEKAKLGM